MRWQAYIVIGLAKRLVPFKREVRSLKRRMFGRKHDIREDVWQGGFSQLALLDESKIAIEGKTVLEVGSGWVPLIPLLYRAAGAEHVILTDMHRIMDHQTLELARTKVIERAEWVSEKIGVDPAIIRERMAVAPNASFNEALAELGLTYAVPFDYAQADRCVDLICSHTVLEHISPEALADLFPQWKRILKPGGVILHGIDHSDHRSNFDRTLSRGDFLRYSDGLWRWLTLDPQDYCNRLRHSEYMQMIDNAGFEVLLERTWVGHKVKRALEAGFPLADRFKNRPIEDLATMWTHVIAR